MNHKTTIAAILIISVCLQACGTMKRNLESGANSITDRHFIVPAAVSQALEDASKSIYSAESLKDGTWVQIESFNIKFYNQKDSFPLRMNNISFFRKGDSAYYKNFTLPAWDRDKYADTMRSVFECHYRNSSGAEPVCISGAYSIKTGKIEKSEAIKPCMQ